MNKICANCGSAELYHFRLDSDWGTGGDYSPINSHSPEKERCDVATVVCDTCHACGDDLAIDDLLYPNPKCTECLGRGWIDKKTYNQFGELIHTIHIDCPACFPTSGGTEP